MLRKIVARKNRVYNHGRKVGLGRLVLECGHEVGHLMARRPVVGEVAHCSRCDRGDARPIVTDCVRVKKGERFEVCPKCGKKGLYRTRFYSAVTYAAKMRCRYCGHRDP
ncbi:MAG: hypothetical protein WC683_02835 [bacterium]